MARALQGVVFALALFGCVVLHELGHALAARRFGIQTTDITLLPIGGLARLQRIPERPSQELVVALAGPAVNVVIAGLLLVAGVAYPRMMVAENAQEIIDPGFWPKLLMVNTLLAVFNMIPAFPMDGGRVLRAILAMRMDYARATRLAASIGQVVAIGLGLLGLQAGNAVLVLIAMFVWIGAEAEAAQVEERAILRGVLVRSAMLTDFLTLRPGDTLGHAADLLLAGSQHDFPVLVGDTTRILTRTDLIQGLTIGGRDARVEEYARTSAEPVEVEGPLAAAVMRLRESGLPFLQVVESGRQVGLLTLENVGEYLMVRTALEAPHPSAPRPDPSATAEFVRGPR